MPTFTVDYVQPRGVNQEWSNPCTGSQPTELRV